MTEVQLLLASAINSITFIQPVHFRELNDDFWKLHRLVGFVFCHDTHPNTLISDHWQRAD